MKTRRWARHPASATYDPPGTPLIDPLPPQPGNPPLREPEIPRPPSPSDPPESPSIDPPQPGISDPPMMPPTPPMHI